MQKFVMIHWFNIYLFHWPTGQALFKGALDITIVMGSQRS